MRRSTGPRHSFHTWPHAFGFQTPVDFTTSFRSDEEQKESSQKAAYTILHNHCCTSLVMRGFGHRVSKQFVISILFASGFVSEVLIFNGLPLNKRKHKQTINIILDSASGKTGKYLSIGSPCASPTSYMRRLEPWDQNGKDAHRFNLMSTTAGTRCLPSTPTDR